MERPFWKSNFSVIIAGRPNVGKSTLFNTIVGRRVSIVDPTPGVTRDRISRTVAHEEVSFDLIDTGGIGIVDMQDLEELVELQIQSAIGMADLVIFVVDARDGITPLDSKVAHALRKNKTPVLCAANKCDVPKFDFDAAQFHALGIPDIFPLSAKERRGIDDLLDKVISFIPSGEDRATENEGLKLALVGRRNVGKSSFVNYLAGEERVIVSDVAGTTRDAVDVSIETKGYSLVAIDTAGIRKKSSIKHPVEFFSTVRTEAAISRADVVVMMIDCVQGISAIEKRLARTIDEEFKPCVIVVNKWDLAGELDPDKYTTYLQKTLPGLDHCPIVYISVKDGVRITPVIKIAEDIFKQWHSEWSTGLINKILQEAWKRNRPHSKTHKLPKIFYATQLRTAPPTFLIFVNRPDIFSDSYRRYLVNFYRKKLNVPEIPIQIIFRQRREDRKKN